MNLGTLILKHKKPTPIRSAVLRHGDLKVTMEESVLGGGHVFMHLQMGERRGSMHIKPADIETVVDALLQFVAEAGA